jgi:hypothetical protein
MLAPILSSITSDGLIDVVLDQIEIVPVHRGGIVFEPSGGLRVVNCFGFGVTIPQPLSVTFLVMSSAASTHPQASDT